MKLEKVGFGNEIILPTTLSCRCRMLKSPAEQGLKPLTIPGDHLGCLIREIWGQIGHPDLNSEK